MKMDNLHKSSKGGNVREELNWLIELLFMCASVCFSSLVYASLDISKSSSYFTGFITCSVVKTGFPRSLINCNHLWEIDEVKLSWMDRCEVLSVRERVLFRHAEFKWVSLQWVLSTGKKIWRGMQSWTKANAKSVWGNISHRAATSACRQNLKHSHVWSVHEQARIKLVGTEWWVSCSRGNSVYLCLLHESHVWFTLSLQLLPPQSLSSSVHQPIVRFVLPRRSFWKNTTQQNIRLGLKCKTLEAPGGEGWSGWSNQTCKVQLN